ncbi:Pre-rRNA-processing protein TSR2-domain-containing protein [Fimicolochytrium jonesii]|uniref:Pre-rRNA-processing protein TSR2-domain-containing protein n=1 Tax=Fimicolochytrium jonesii TaxID=1396493 RepID=UPI0022FF191C|nr:Pre-rRNA-processing protein TSR2-domain-containing protein [Fimicolochytrium jonesii]KAI8822936.1 Pre-rRNA-processing protein TSR2-domain-containing protein [Fimicolochytrium jonesii]
MTTPPPTPLPLPARLTLFTTAVRLVFDRWTALQLALDHQMAGTSTPQRATELLEHTLDFFTQYKSDVEAHEIAENLKAFFNEIFNAELDDGSPEQIGRTLVRCWREVVEEGDATGVEEMRRKAEQARTRNAGRQSQSQRHPSNEDSSSSDEESDGDAEVVAEAGATGSINRDDGGAAPMEVDEEPAARRPEPVVDEDGFELVQNTRKGRRRN